jgi:hypothetical protein
MLLSMPAPGPGARAVTRATGTGRVQVGHRGGGGRHHPQRRAQRGPGAVPLAGRRRRRAGGARPRPMHTPPAIKLEQGSEPGTRTGPRAGEAQRRYLWPRPQAAPGIDRAPPSRLNTRSTSARRGPGACQWTRRSQLSGLLPATAAVRLKANNLKPRPVPTSQSRWQWVAISVSS